MPMRLFYAESLSAGQSTSSGAWDDLAGLTLTLPAATGDEKFALVTLNVPAPYAKGSDYPGCNFAIKVDPHVGGGIRLNPIGCFTSFNKVADPATAISSGRVPVTVVGRVMLKGKPTILQGVWQAVRGATALVDTPCSISAVTGKG